MPLGTEVGLGPGDIVLDAAEVPQKGHAPIFGLCTPCLKNVPLCLAITLTHMNGF